MFTNFGPFSDWVNAVAIDTDGKILAVGGSWAAATGSNVRIALARYGTNGQLDTSFGGDGKVLTNLTPGYDYAEDVVIQSDGNIVVVGLAGGAGGRFALARYLPDGTLDPAFGGGDGRVMTNFNTGEDDATSVALQPDGKIVAAGWSGPARSSNYRFAVARYLAGGGLDNTFHTDGKNTTNFTPGNDFAWDMALQADGRIVAVGGAAGMGYRFALARYTSSGHLDTAFAGDGTRINDLNTGSDVLTGVGVQGDGKIVASGWTGRARSSDYRFAVARYSIGGSLDDSFSGNGWTATNFTTGNDYAWDITLQTDGKIVAVGRAGGAGGRFALARYQAV